MLSAKSSSVVSRPAAARRAAFKPCAVSTLAKPAVKAAKELKPLNVTKNNLLDSQGGECEEEGS